MNSLKFPILLSVVFHCFFLVQMPGLRHLLPHEQKPARDFKVSYVLTPSVSIPQAAKETAQKTTPPHATKEETRIVSNHTPPKQTAAKEKQYISPVLKPSKAVNALVLKPTSKKTVNETSVAKARKIQAIRGSYQEVVRGKIRNSIEYPSYDIEGEVNVNFSVFQDGRLQSVSVQGPCDERLKNAVIEGIKKASPFPSAPKALSKKMLYFKLKIYFQRNI